MISDVCISRDRAHFLPVKLIGFELSLSKIWLESIFVYIFIHGSCARSLSAIFHFCECYFVIYHTIISFFVIFQENPRWKWNVCPSTFLFSFPLFSYVSEILSLKHKTSKLRVETNIFTADQIIINWKSELDLIRLEAATEAGWVNLPKKSPQILQKAAVTSKMLHRNTVDDRRLAHELTNSWS